MLGEIFRENPSLYARYREESTLTTHGETLRASYARSHGSFGVDQRGVEVTKSQAIGDEIFAKATCVLAKSAEISTFEQALDRVFLQQPELFDQYRRASYA